MVMAASQGQFPNLLPPDRFTLSARIGRIGGRDVEEQRRPEEISAWYPAVEETGNPAMPKREVVDKLSIYAPQSKASTFALSMSQA